MRILVALFLAMLLQPALAMESQFDRVQQVNRDLVKMLVKQEVLSQDAANLLTGNPDGTLAPMVRLGGTDALSQSTSNLVQMLAQRDVLTQQNAEELTGSLEQSSPEALKESTLNLITMLKKNGTLPLDAASKLEQEMAPAVVEVASIPPSSAVPAPQAGPAASPRAVPAAAASVQAQAAPAMAAAPVKTPADTIPMDPTMKKLVGMLVQKGVITQDAANQLLQKEPVRQGEVRVPYVPEVVKNEIKDEIKDEVLAQAHGERWGDPETLPGWLSRISFEGDLRVRFQHNGFPSGNVIPSQYNPAGIILIPNTTETHDYLLLASHFAINAKMSDYTKATLRLTTGNTANPDTTNQTLGGGGGSYYAANAPVGTNGDFNKYSVVMDRAYIQSDPYAWLSLSAGKIPNPWLSTDLVWDYDVNFDGLAGSLKPQFNDDWMGFMTAGIFPVQDLERSVTQLANSKWLFGGQLGGQWTSPNQSTIKFGMALYDFTNIQGEQNTPANPDVFDKTAASTMQKGNTLMYVTPPNNNWGTAGAALPPLYGIASKFRELDFTGKMDLATFDPTHIMFQADYVKNLGFDPTQILARAVPLQSLSDARTTAYHLNLMVGMPEMKEIGDWQAKIAYKYIGSDAVLDALNDQDFHLGGTNAKGFIIGGQYGIDKNTWVKVRWLSSDQVTGPPLAIDVLQCDLNTRF